LNFPQEFDLDMADHILKCWMKCIPRGLTPLTRKENHAVVCLLDHMIHHIIFRREFKMVRITPREGIWALMT
jgi:hypothetical protein